VVPPSGIRRGAPWKGTYDQADTGSVPVWPWSGFLELSESVLQMVGQELVPWSMRCVNLAEQAIE